MTAEEQGTVLALQSLVVQKASEDAGFRAELLANPKAAVEKLAGAPLPGGYSIQVVEAPANTTIVALPHQTKAGSGGELADADLENVAGGSKSGAKAFFGGVGDVFKGLASGLSMSNYQASSIALTGKRGDPANNAVCK